jgi:predicted nucleic acid-binding protein
VIWSSRGSTSGAWILHELSAVDATSFAVMRRARIRTAFTFDHHFAAAGFRLVA